MANYQMAPIQSPLPGTSWLFSLLLICSRCISLELVSSCSSFNFSLSDGLRPTPLFSSQRYLLAGRNPGNLRPMPNRDSNLQITGTRPLNAVNHRRATRAARVKGLTDIAVRNARARDRAYKLSDGRGLCLLVQPNGSKWWRFRYVGQQRKNAVHGHLPRHLARGSS
jgi:hypothetical protein